MSYNEYRIIGFDGTGIFIREWFEVKEPKGVICFVHGLGEHGGRYKEVAEFFNENDYIFVIADLRGFGQSGGKRGHVTNYDCYMEDIGSVLIEVRKHFPGNKQYLYGHSLGGNLVANFAIRYKIDIQKIIVSSPWLRVVTYPSSIKSVATMILNQVYPSYTMSNNIKPEDLTQRNTVNLGYDNDESMSNQMSARLYSDVTSAGEWAIQNAKKLVTPTLLMHGNKDKICSMEATKEFAEKTICNCALKIWDEMYHELHNEVRAKEILTYVVKWLAEKE